MNTQTSVAAAIDEAVKAVGGIASLVSALDVKGPTVAQWKSGKRPVPPARAAQLEQLTGVSRIRFRPKDGALIWPELSKRRQRAA